MVAVLESNTNLPLLQKDGISSDRVCQSVVSVVSHQVCFQNKKKTLLIQCETFSGYVEEPVGGQMTFEGLPPVLEEVNLNDPHDAPMPVTDEPLRLEVLPPDQGTFIASSSITTR